MAALKPSVGRLIPGSSILFLCDMQEKFRYVAYFPQIVSVAARMLKVARMLEVPAVLTEQYPKGLGATVPELGAEGLRPFPKTSLSMVPVVRQELDSRPQLRSVLLCGIEAQACIMNTALDLLDRGLQVHVVVDACSARKSRRSSSSLSRTPGCWASSKARTPSFSEHRPCLQGSPPSCHRDGESAFPPSLDPKSGAIHREYRPLGKGSRYCLAIGRQLQEMQMTLLEAGRELAEGSWRRGSAPGHFTGRGGEGESQTVWDPDSQNKH
ncbi:isochorismatase domain-containing protein 2 isoform X1 [Diceros bicornis minor]|uniref:isochorismatase domain-containing protein 2 isoform X1 n=1 Tax=Diceros bicornis minor TaxID=77932 RepID=UPI0026F30BBC|nr:isochorismatase domain-containing protein 2 isoform X1 [Diceros bicornis minor]